MQQGRRLVFLSGRVMLDDGTEPPERASIERICNGRARREAYTDAHGAFAFQLGMNNDVFQDASVGGNDSLRGPSSLGSGSYGMGSTASTSMQTSGVSATDLAPCELRASLAGFRSDTISLAGRQLSDNPDVGTIVLHRLGKVEGTKISVTTLQAPREARKAWERAQGAMAKKNHGAAVTELEKAVAVCPKFAEAQGLLGQLYFEQGRKDDAGRVLQQAIEADPNFVPPVVLLALLAGQQRDWERMQELSERALALNAYEYPAAYFYAAIANFNLHKFDVAEKNARKARRLDSQYRMPRINLLLADILLQRRDYAGAAEQLRSFLKYEPTGEQADSSRLLLGRTEQMIASAPAAEPAASAMAPPK